MEKRREYFKKINDNLVQMNSTVDYLNKATNTYAKNRIINKLKSDISNLLTLTQSMEISENTGENSRENPVENPRENPVEKTHMVFTPMELSKYTGKDGTPAYVAVNGIVYDVTDAPGWTKGRHYGVTAGKDITNEFEACHMSPIALKKLKVVGKMEA